MDEAELSRRFPTGDEECLEEAVARYGQALLRYCHHILCDCPAAGLGSPEPLPGGHQSGGVALQAGLSRLHRPDSAAEAAALCPSPAARSGAGLYRAGAAGGPGPPHRPGAGAGVRPGNGGAALQ